MKRTETRKIMVGNVQIGGQNKVVIQSMCNTKTKNVEDTVNQILELEKAGCEIIRVACLDIEDAKAIKKIKEKIHYLINEKGIEQEEIILLYPPNFTDNEESKIYNNKTCGKLSKSIIEKIIKNELNLELNDLTDGLSKINEHGIKLSTTGKAIGLDFKAVIIFGLYNIRASRYNNIEFNNIATIKDANNDIKKEVINNMKNIYVAASRAREFLYIIDDIDGTTKNIISEYAKKIGEK